jgi:hypothetical protein
MLKRPGGESLYVWGTNPYARSLISFAHGPHIINSKLQGNVINAALSLKERLTLAGAPDLDNTYILDASIEVVQDEINKFLTYHQSVVLLSPNCTWDADVIDMDSIFNGVVDWVKKTCDYVEQISDTVDIGLIIRLHPAEKTLWRHLPCLQDQLPSRILESSRVLFISGAFPLSSAQIASRCCLAVAYAGKTIQEIAWLCRTPVVVVSNSIDSQTPGVFSPSTIDQYFSVIREASLHTSCIPTNLAGSADDVESFHQKLHGSGFNVSEEYPYSGYGVPAIDYTALNIILDWCIKSVDNKYAE